MDLNELKNRLNGYEWTDIEFKSAQTDVPRNAYETVSAFANASGGWIVFGVQECNGNYNPIGVTDPDRIQNDFLSSLRADNKVNHDINPTAQMFDIEGQTLLVFHIPEASRQNKPVYLNGDIRRTFIRRGGCDQRCKMNEIERFLRDATEDRWDGQIRDFPLEEAFDKESVKWYRAMFNNRNPGHDESLSDQEFFYQWGYLLRQDDKLLPTRAGIILFGSPAAIHQMLPRPTLDVQWIPTNFGDPLPEVRWLDRVVYEDNLIITWRGLVQKYMQYEPKPFRIDPHTLMRDDTPPGYRVFREAAINLLIHQDYADHSRKAVIKFYKDVIQFWNPGDVFGSDVNLLEPGEKEVRNPRIAAAFRRLALCEQAGTGIRMMTTQWQQLGNPAPQYDNDRSRKAFEIRLGLAAGAVFAPSTDQVGTKSGLSQDQILSDEEIEHILHNDNALSWLETTFAEATGQVAGQVTGQVAAQVLNFCQKPRSSNTVQELLKLKHRETFVNNYLKPLLASGFIEMTIPDKPRSSKQKYRLTDKGRQILKALNNTGKDN